MADTVAAFTVSVGAACTITRWFIRRTFDTVYAKRRWYKKLTDIRRHRLSGALAVAAHHCVVVGGIWYALVNDRPDLYYGCLFIEIGFDVFDSLAALLGVSFTGVAKLPVLMHHTVALTFSSLAVSTNLISWPDGATIALNLLGAGIVDTLVMRVLPFSAYYGSDLLMSSISLVHFAVFLKCRAFGFTRQAYHLLNRFPATSPLFSTLGAACGALMLYHVALGFSILKMMGNCGRFPKASREFLEAMAQRRQARKGKKEDDDGEDFELPPAVLKPISPTSSRFEATAPPQLAASAPPIRCGCRAVAATHCKQRGTPLCAKTSCVGRLRANKFHSDRPLKCVIKCASEHVNIKKHKLLAPAIIQSLTLRLARLIVE